MNILDKVGLIWLLVFMGHLQLSGVSLDVDLRMDTEAPTNGFQSTGLKQEIDTLFRTRMKASSFSPANRCGLVVYLSQQRQKFSI